jgi:5,10-methylenetetrahydromethanopterin reductase
MLRLAGEVADGVLLSAGSSRPYVAQCLDIVGDAAAGRDVARIGLVYATPVPSGAQREAALAPLRRRLAFVLRGAHHANNLSAAGTLLDQARLHALTQAGEWDAAMALVTDEVIARHAAIGTEATLAASLDAYRAAGLDEVVLSNLADATAIAETLRAAGG